MEFMGRGANNGIEARVITGGAAEDLDTDHCFFEGVFTRKRDLDGETEKLTHAGRIDKSWTGQDSGELMTD